MNKLRPTNRHMARILPFAFLLISTQIHAQAFCPLAPYITATPTVIHNPSANQSLTLEIFRSKSDKNLTNTAFRSALLYKERDGFETMVNASSVSTKAPTFTITGISGSPTATVDATVSFDQALNGMPNWKNTNGQALPSARMQWSAIQEKQDSSTTYQLTFPSGQSPLAGDWVIEVAAYTFYSRQFIGCPGFTAGSNYQRVFSALSFNYKVPYSASLNVTGGTSSGSINFNGVNGLKTGEKKAINLNLNANGPYKIRIDSLNNGFLKHQTAGFETELIPYTATLGGTTIVEGTALSSSSATTGTENKAFEITVGNTDNARQGTYRDTITVTISQN